MKISEYERRLAAMAAKITQLEKLVDEVLEELTVGPTHKACCPLSLENKNDLRCALLMVMVEGQSCWFGLQALRFAARRKLAYTPADKDIHEAVEFLVGLNLARRADPCLSLGDSYCVTSEGVLEYERLTMCGHCSFEREFSVPRRATSTRSARSSKRRGRK